MVPFAESCGSNVTTNNNPKVIKNNFIDCIRRGGVISMRLRTDCETENVTMATIQYTLRHHQRDYYAGARNHMYGSSVGNQCIESWWSIFRKQRYVTYFAYMFQATSSAHFLFKVGYLLLPVVEAVFRSKTMPDCNIHLSCFENVTKVT